MGAATIERVPANTPAALNDEIVRQTRESIWRHVNEGADGIENRLEDLDYEWDIERVLETNAAAVSLAGIALGTLVDRRFYAVSALAAGFLLQHALQGWCPPMPVFRRWGFRTQTEIERERYTLKAVRGDFVGVIPTHSGRDAAPVQAAVEAVNL